MLQLDAMTIRGIGSYIRGARLEMRPLTILSGVNGSGKSTWFKTLAMLRQSAGDRLLPFAFAVDDSNAYDVGFVNYSLYCSDDATGMVDAEEQTRNFGPPACVGLDFSITNDCEIGEPIESDWSPENGEQRFLIEGRCTKGMKLRVRLAHPTGDVDTHIRPVIPGMYHHVELSVNGNVLQFGQIQRGRESLIG